MKKAPGLVLMITGIFACCGAGWVIVDGLYVYSFALFVVGAVLWFAGLRWNGWL